MISKKLTFLKRIKELAERQEDLLAKEGLDAFMALLTQRSHLQRMIDKLDELDAKDKETGRKPFDEKSESLALEISEVIASIQETDRKIETMILKRKCGLIREIQDLREGKRAVKGYGGKPGFPARYIDQHK